MLTYTLGYLDCKYNCTNEWPTGVVNVADTSNVPNQVVWCWYQKLHLVWCFLGYAICWSIFSCQLLLLSGLVRDSNFCSDVCAVGQNLSQFDSSAPSPAVTSLIYDSSLDSWRSWTIAMGGKLPCSWSRYTMYNSISKFKSHEHVL